MSKKNFFNKNSTAAIITVILVIAGFLIGGIGPLSSQRRIALSFFSAGHEVIAGRMIEHDIMGDLHSSLGWAANLATVAERHFPGNQPEIAALRQARTSFIEFLGETEAHTLRADLIFFHYNGLRYAASELENLLLANNVDEAEFASIMEELTRADVRIMRVGERFNDIAEEFNETLGRFPAVLFRITGLIRPLDLFGRVLL